jgi:transcriptional regulator with XRE-family HTH domain
MTITQLKKIMKQRKLTYQNVIDELGLSNRSTVSQWFARGAIPKHWQKHLKEKYATQKRN